MPTSPAGATPSRMLRVLDKALGQSHDVKAEVQACAEDLGSANDLAKARMSDGATTLPAAQALQDSLAMELRVQGCADDLQLVTDNLAHGLAEVKTVEEALTRSRAALAKSEAALAESRRTERTAGQVVTHDQKAGFPDRLPFDDGPPPVMVRAGRNGWMRDMASGVDDADTSVVPTRPVAVDRSGEVIKVVLVDDDAFMRDLIHHVLVGAGMQVTSYASAAELLGAGDLAAATVLLLDVKMPGMSGMDLQELLRRRGVELPVVFISGAADLAVAVTAMRNGAVDFIEKPFQGALLVERVRRAVTHQAERGATSEQRADPLVLARFETLSPREREVFDLLVTGMSSKLIARELGGSFRTIEIHRAQVMRKMAARHLPELVRMSIESMAPRSVHAR